MDLEDLLKGKHHHGHNHGHHDHGYHHGHYKMKMIQSVLRSLPHKKALLAGLIIVFFIIVILGIMVIWALFPLLSMLLELVQDKGIQGILEALNAFIQKLWKGNG